MSQEYPDVNELFKFEFSPRVNFELDVDALENPLSLDI
jgi:hypothetical protein